MSEKATIADNQQGSRSPSWRVDPSETTRRAPFSEVVIKAYFLSALHDGTFSQNKRFRISQKGVEWLKFLQQLLKSISYNSWIYQEGKERDIHVLETVASFLNFNFDPSKLKNKEEMVAYVRGFFDAEGGIPHCKKDRFYIQLTQNDRFKLEKIKNILEEIGIESGKIHNPSHRKHPEYWRMNISTKSHKIFIQLIGSWHPRKIRILRERMVI